MKQPTTFILRSNRVLPIPVEDAGVVILSISHGMGYDIICKQLNEGKRWECRFSSDELGQIGRIIAEGIEGDRTRLTYQPSEKVKSEELKLSVANAFPAKHIVFSDEERYKVVLAQHLAWMKSKRPKVWSEIVYEFSDQIDTNPVLRDTDIGHGVVAMEKPAPEIPKRRHYRDRWIATWNKIKPYVEQGMTYDEIDGRLAKFEDDYRYSYEPETMSKIIAAGKDGKLDTDKLS